MLSKLLHPFPSILVNDSRLGVWDNLPLVLWLIHGLVYLVADRGGHKVYRTACILLVDKNAGDCFLIPSVWVCVLFPCLSAERSVIGSGNKHLFLFKLPCNLRRSPTVKAQSIDFSYNFRRRFIYQPILFVLLVSDISKWDGGTDTLAVCCLVLPHRTDFLACLSRIPLIENVVERHHLCACFFQGIDIFLNGDEPYAQRWVLDFKVVTHIKIVSAKATQIFYDNGVYHTLLHQVLHLNKTRSVEGRTRKSIIREKLRIREIIPLSVCK